MTRLESLIKDYKIADEKMQKEVNKLMFKKLNLQTDLDNAIAEVDKLEKELSDREKQMRNVKSELNR